MSVDGQINRAARRRQQRMERRAHRRLSGRGARAAGAILGVGAAVAGTAPAASALSCSSNYASDVQNTPGLISYFRLGEAAPGTPIPRGTTASDVKGAHNGTYEGGAQGTSGALFCDSNSAASFDGTGDVSVPWLGQYSQWTIEGWSNLAANASGNNTLYGSISGPRLMIRPGGFYADDFTTRTSVGATQGSTASNVGRWVYWALERNGTSLTLYRDGVAVGTSSVGSEGVTTLNGYIGKQRGNGYFMNGGIDEVAVYAGALSQGSITQHYNEALGNGCGTYACVS